MANKNNGQGTGIKTAEDIFNRARSSIFNIDPVTFCENNLTLDGRPFKLRRNGYKPFVDIYRYIGLHALDKNSRPIVLVKGRQVGATTMAANLEMYWTCSGLFGTNGRPPIRIMHCFPQLDLAMAYSKTKLNPTITQSVQVGDKSGRTKGVIELELDSSTEDSLYFKKFRNENHLWVDSTGVDADRIRGRTVDCIIFDEVQDMFKRAILNARKISVQSQYGKTAEGIQVYLGTPKSKDSVYYEMWINSNQNYFHMGCESCGQYFPFYTPGSDLWEEIWLDDFHENCPHCNKKFNHDISDGFQIKCTNCNHIQDKRVATELGKWISSKSNSENCQYVGFHINQLYMPNFDKKAIMNLKPGSNPLADETSWQNEVLGEFYSGDGTTITTEEIKAKCSDYGRRFARTILPDECSHDRNVYLGGDWGKLVDVSAFNKGDIKAKGPQGQSYSCLVILQVIGPQLFSVQFATKLKQNDPQYKKEIIEKLMIDYNVRLAVADIGYAHDLMRDLQSTYGDQFLASEASGSKIMGHVRFNDNDVPKTIVFERNFYIQEMFELLRKGAVRFPMMSWEQVAWLINHCASMVAKPEMDKYGNIKMKYAKGNIPNDGLMALINAYLAYKFDVTNGFRDKNKMLHIADIENYSKPVGGSIYLPKMRITM